VIGSVRSTKDFYSLLQIRWLFWTVVSALSLLTFALYWPAINGSFIWDDSFNILENPLLKSSDGLSQIWTRRIDPSASGPQNYPLTTTLFWIEWQLWGDNPMGYHIVNVVLHAINALLVWKLLSHLKISGAWLIGLIFLVHPVCVESVAWITEQKNVLSGLFFLLSLGSYLRFEDTRQWHWYIITIGLFVLALLSKPSTVMLPVVLLLYRWWLLKPWSWREVLLLIPFFMLSAFAGAGTIWFEQHSVGAVGAAWTAGLPEKIAIAGQSIWFYIGKVFIPFNLSFIYPRWTIDPSKFSSYVPIVILLLFVLLIVWRKNGWGRPVIMGLGFFIVNLFPVLGFFEIYFMRYSYVADHFQYLASMGLMALGAGSVVWSLEQLDRIRLKGISGQMFVICFGLTVVVILGTLTWKQTHNFKDEEAVWRDVIDKNPKAWLAHNNMGVIYREKGELREAARAFETALRIKPDYVAAYNNLGLVYFDLGFVEQSIDQYKTALMISPNYVIIRSNLGSAYFSQGSTEEALKEFERVVALEPDHVDAHYNLGVIYQMKGLFDEAIKEYQVVLRIDPQSADAHNNLGVIYNKFGWIDKAVTEFKESLKIDPDFVKARRNLAEALELNR
jgi:tetratricopeptide (TPR) repeat protein